MMKRKNSYYPTFFSRLPVCTDRDVLVLECQLRGARQDVWVQLARLPRHKVRLTSRLTLPVCCDRSFIFADGKTLAGSRIILGYDLSGRLVAIFWREKLRRPWRYEFDLSELSERPIELRPGCRCVFTTIEWAQKFHNEFVEAATGEFNSEVWRDIFDHIIDVRGILPVAEIFPAQDEGEEDEE